MPAAPSKILVTGANGFIGGASVGALKARGFDVLTPTSAELNLFDRDAVRAYLARERPSHLVHAAWRSVRGDVMASADNYGWLNASLALAESFYGQGGARAVFLGSSAEYDWRWGMLRVGETPLRPQTPYGAAKLALYMALESYLKPQGASYAWLRVFFVYGQGEHDSRLGAYVARNLLAGKAARLSHGRQVRDYVHVDDVAEGVALGLLSDHQGETDLASGAPISVRELAFAIARQVGREDLLEFGARPQAAAEAPVLLGDPTHAEAHISWRPGIELEEGVRRLVEWTRAQA